jgi:type 1 fimbria pilin
MSDSNSTLLAPVGLKSLPVVALFNLSSYVSGCGGRTRRINVALSVLLVALPDLAQACSASVSWPIVADREKPGYREEIHMLVDGGTNVYWERCPAGSDLEVSVDVQGPGLRWVMDLPVVPVWPVEGALPLYETGPDSPLIGFVTDHDGPRRPLRLGDNALIVPSGRTGFILNAFMFSRGQKMRDTQTLASVRITERRYPSFDVTVPVDIKIAFPPTTCRTQDASEVLQDVAAADLSNPGDTAWERPVSLLMDCGIARPRVDMLLLDAGDAGNTGSVLTPTTDSTAEGVRVQLLDAGREVQFGTPWFFNPGAGGVHTLEYTARYLRMNEELKPGSIRGEAVLNMDYW